ncbi:late histone H2B.L4 [Saccopteryx bilineata]|uniref:late histone H2B.L4 n=1 Tax=Saccopteryx bilineata TaxID=59482 RepID=UPI00338D7F69
MKMKNKELPSVNKKLVEIENQGIEESNNDEEDKKNSQQPGEKPVEIYIEEYPLENIETQTENIPFKVTLKDIALWPNVPKQVHPDISTSSKDVSIINSYVNDTFEQLASKATWLDQYSGQTTPISREAQTTMHLLLSGELVKHAVSNSTKAITKWSGT